MSTTDTIDGIKNNEMNEFAQPCASVWQYDHVPLEADRPETVMAAYPDDHCEVLCANIFYVAADGGTRICNLTFANTHAKKAAAMRDVALQFATPFVRQQWCRIEVSTPRTNCYGRTDGGYIRLAVQREPRPAPEGACRFAR